MAGNVRVLYMKQLKLSDDSTLVGDVNQDGIINVLDVVSLVNIILSGSDAEYMENQGYSASAADINTDGVINVLDVVALVNYILDGGS